MGELLKSVELLVEGAGYFRSVTVPDYYLLRTKEPVCIRLPTTRLGNGNRGCLAVEIKHTASYRPVDDAKSFADYVRELVGLIGPFDEVCSEASGLACGNGVQHKTVDDYLTEVEERKFTGSVAFKGGLSCSRKLSLAYDSFSKEIAVRIVIVGQPDQILHYAWGFDKAVYDYLTNRTSSALPASRQQE